MTDTNKFRSLCKQQIVRLEKDQFGRDLTHEDIQVVFMSYVLGQMKATLVVAKDTDGRYYECSYSYLNQKLFVDIYKKIGDIVVNVGE